MISVISYNCFRSFHSNLDAQNWVEVKKAAHKFKPSLDFMDVVSLKKEIRLIEKYAGEESHLDELPNLIQFLEKTEVRFSGSVTKRLSGLLFFWFSGTPTQLVKLHPLLGVGKKLIECS